MRILPVRHGESKANAEPAIYAAMADQVICELDFFVFLLKGLADSQSASNTGCDANWEHDKESGIGAGRGHSGIFST